MSDWTAERQRSAFADAYLRSRAVFPGMGGRHVDQFHAVVMATAEAQKADPEQLFRKHLATWLKSVPRAALKAPYAFFAQAWGELADRGPTPVEEAPRGAKVDYAGKLAELRAQYSVLEGQLAAARVVGGERQASAEQALERCRGEMRAVKRDGGL